MSGGTWVTVKAKGFATGAKGLLGKSRAPTRVKDAQTLLVLTPVGLAGDVDLQVQQSSLVSIKGRAFPYHLAQARNWQTTAMLEDGALLVIGGNLSVAPNDCALPGWQPTSAVERIDPVAGTVVAFDSLPDKNFVMTAATMQDGSVVSAGGASCGGGNASPYFYFLQGEPPPQ